MSRTTRLVGDIHGKYLDYLAAIDGCHDSIQIGDFGFGFGTLGQAEFVDSLLNDMSGTHRMIRGNHDSLDEAQRSRHFIPDMTVEHGTFFLGGAASIDRAYRIEGISWWANEELSVEELEDAIAVYKATKPRVVISHECPEFLARDAMVPLVGGIVDFQSRTRDAMDVMFYHHQPELWVFGHWHKSVNVTIEGTNFVCLDILETMDVQL